MSEIRPLDPLRQIIFAGRRLQHDLARIAGRNPLIRWEGFDLTAENRRMLYVPGGIAHGFQCRADNCEVFYQMSEVYYPDLARGIISPRLSAG